MGPVPRCNEWADKGSNACKAWADKGSDTCSSWADKGHADCKDWRDKGANKCREWADHGHKHCCSWWPCSWACRAFYWVANWVCVAWYWVANWVCQAWYWVANWVCQAWYWVAKWVCVGWYWVAKWVCMLWGWTFGFSCRNTNGGPMFLLTDGTVLMNECEDGFGTHRWWRLQPDATGSYTAGTWSTVADSSIGRKYFASAVLADGRVLVCGGEYSDASGTLTADDTATTSIYDPVANTWTAVAPPPGVTKIGDSPCCLLPDGRFLLGSFNGQSVYIFDPSLGSWSPAAAKGDSGSEETWVLLADGTVVAPQCTTGPNAEKYVVATDRWVSAGALKADIVEASSSEIGPGILLPDPKGRGRALFIGAKSGNTALYTPGAAPSDQGSWANGAAIPPNGTSSQGSKDGPGALLPSGSFLFPVSPVDGVTADYLSPSSFFESDGTTMNRVTDPPNANCPTYVGRMMLIPSGQVIWAREDDTGIYAYTEDASFADAYRPVVTAAPSTLAPGSTVTISGTQFNGLSQAVSYGDDYTAATNYPIVRIRHKASGGIRYCRTFNHIAGATPSMGVATGGTIITTQVAIPGDVAPGESELVVVANGIPSIPFPVMVAVPHDGRARSAGASGSQVGS